MGTLPKPLIGLLLGTVAFFAIWMVALKPSSSSSNGGSQGGVGQYQPAINKAHEAVTTSNQANAKLGAPTSTTPAAKPTTPAERATRTPAKAAPVTKAKSAAKTAVNPARAAKPAPATKPAAVSTADQVTTVQNAIRDHKVLAMLFYNPAGSDDQSMVEELAAVKTHGLPIVKVAVPLSALTQFGMITSQVSVVTSPTLVIIDPQHQATTITGFASSGEIGTRIADAAVVNK
jgi:hypothetical protein